jgi:endoglucanase
MPSANSLHPLAARRAAHLRKGINLSHWYSQVYAKAGYTPEHFDRYNTAADVALIAQMGFDHVRFPIACEPFFDRAKPHRLDESYVSRLDAVIRLLHKHGLAVMVDIHPETPFKEWLRSADENAEAFAKFWGAFAGRLSHFDPELTVFEILNEPCVFDAAKWNAIQNAAMAAVRAAAPDHTIIVSGDDCSQIPELLKLDPPTDRNVIHNFHLYDPIAITHQGAGWSPPWAMFTVGLAYPVDPAQVSEIQKNVTDPKALQKLDEYREEDWSLPVYQRFLDAAVAWGETHGVPLTCNEFGVYKKYAPRATRLAWERDISSLLAKNGIGWTKWDYAGDFAIVKAQDGKRVPDDELVTALGLR